jgi:hypothetical protein
VRTYVCACVCVCVCVCVCTCTAIAARRQQRKSLEAGIVTLQQQHKSELDVLLKLSYFIGQYNLPIVLFTSLIELVKELGVNVQQQYDTRYVDECITYAGMFDILCVYMHAGYKINLNINMYLLCM